MTEKKKFLFRVPKPQTTLQISKQGTWSEADKKSLEESINKLLDSCSVDELKQLAEAAADPNVKDTALRLLEQFSS